MVDSGSSVSDAEILQSRKALSRWDNEGGLCAVFTRADTPESTDAQLVQLRIRVIAPAQQDEPAGPSGRIKVT